MPTRSSKPKAKRTKRPSDDLSVRSILDRGDPAATKETKTDPLPPPMDDEPEPVTERLPVGSPPRPGVRAKKVPARPAKTATKAATKGRAKAPAKKKPQPVAKKSAKGAASPGKAARGLRLKPKAK